MLFQFHYLFVWFVFDVIIIAHQFNRINQTVAGSTKPVNASYSIFFHWMNGINPVPSGWTRRGYFSQTWRSGRSAETFHTTQNNTDKLAFKLEKSALLQRACENELCSLSFTDMNVSVEEQRLYFMTTVVLYTNV